MYITLLCVGRLKEKYWQQAYNEYAKRLNRYHRFTLIEVADEKDPEHGSDAAVARLLDKEGERLAAHLKDDHYIIALAIDGKSHSSEQFAAMLRDCEARLNTHLTFIIGGSYGLSPEILKRADLKLSFSAMTFPHQLMRVLFTEQLYRAARINSGQSYHK